MRSEHQTLWLLYLSSTSLIIVIGSIVFAWSSIMKIWNKKWAILTGFWNNLFPTAYIKRVYKKRMAICEGCSLIDRVGNSCFVPGTQPCCGDCGCKLAYKLKVLNEECGIGNWKPEMTERQYNEFKKKHNIVEE